MITKPMYAVIASVVPSHIELALSQKRPGHCPQLAAESGSPAAQAAMECVIVCDMSSA